MATQGLHDPNLRSILMVERAIHKAKTYQTKKKLWKSLPRQMQYQTFNQIIDYLIASRKILLNHREIVWVFADNPTLKKTLANATKVR